MQQIIVLVAPGEVRSDRKPVREVCHNGAISSLGRDPLAKALGYLVQQTQSFRVTAEHRPGVCGMSTTQVQSWIGTRFSIERKRGNAPGVVIISLTGPFTARDMYSALTPIELMDALNPSPVAGEEPAVLNILDLTSVPYMDSCGLGMIVTHYTRSQNRGLKMIAAGASPRVLELMRLTKIDTIIPLAATVEAAEGA